MSSYLCSFFVLSSCFCFIVNSTKDWQLRTSIPMPSYPVLQKMVENEKFYAAFKMDMLNWIEREAMS